MTSRLGRSDSDMSSSSSRGRVGLSDYTAQKLAELRARRAELDSDYSDFKTAGTKSRTESSSSSTSATSPSSSSSSPATSTPSTTAPSTSDLLESYRARRGLTSTSASSPTHSSKLDYLSSNGTAASTNGTSSLSSTIPKSAASSTKPVASAKPPSLQSNASSTSQHHTAVSSSDSKLSNGHVSSSVMGKTSGGSSSLSSAASFSKADYTSSQRSGALDQLRGSTSLSRSVSARVTPNPLEDDDECVGFASLPEQVHRKAVKRGFDFTLMVVGETGLGKSTLISSLFLNTDLYKDREIPSVQERLAKTVRVEKHYMEIEEKGVKLRLSIVDTPGFNDSMDSEQTWKPIEEYINSQFEQYFKDESGLNRKNIKDNRVHCCLYFVSPYGHGLRPIDVQFMRRLHEKVNIVPIIAKADTLTFSEVRRLKDKILEQVEENRIKIYEFPDCDSDEDEDFKQQDAELKASIPFAVIGSNTVVEVGGKKVRGRLYPWGVVEVDNPQHCDFSKLRMMLISTHMQDLKDVTRDIHYENYRARHIKEQMTKSQRERNKLKRDSSPNFESIIDQDQLLEEKDEEIRQMQAMIMKMQEQLKGKGPGNGPAPMVGLGNL